MKLNRLEVSDAIEGSQRSVYPSTSTSGIVETSSKQKEDKLMSRSEVSVSSPQQFHLEQHYSKTTRQFQIQCVNRRYALIALTN